MSIPAIVQVQRDFSGGELDPLALRRDDAKIMRAGLKTATNMRPETVGPITRREGWRAVFSNPGRIGTARPAPDKRFWVEFTGSTVNFRLIETPATIHSNFAPLPWGTADLAKLSWSAAGRFLFICHRDGTVRPQVFQYDRSSDTWDHSVFAFEIGPTGETRQPFYRFADTRGVTMGPNGRTGSITVDFSAAVLEAGHVGARFRYIDREVEVTAVNSATNATVNVIDELPPAYQINASAGFSGFAVGEIVEGVDSGAVGEVSEIVSSTAIVVQIHEGHHGFIDGETVVGPKSQVGLNTTGGVNAAANPRPVPTWTEQFVSDQRGWPGHVAFDRQRVIFSRFPQFQQAIIWSAVTSAFDFEVTADADGAIFEYIAGDGTVEMVVGGPDQFVLTDDGIYYIPISASSPLAPGSVEFRLISSDAAAPIRPVWTPQGMVFVSQAGSRVMALVPTGQTAQPYIVEDISAFHGHLIKNPVELAVLGQGDLAKERMVYVVNGDGTMAMARYNRSEEWVGWFPWVTHGAATGIASMADELLAAFDHGGGTVTAEELSAAHRFDTSIDKDDTTLLGLFVGTEMDVWGDDRYLGKRLIEAGGTVEGDPLPAGAYLGFAIEPMLTPFTPNMGEGESVRQRMRRRKIRAVAVTVHETTGFNIGSRIIASYRGGEDQNNPPPQRSETYRHRALGRSHEPEVTITQPVPGDLTIVEISMEVTV